ncbi:hypothetical protein LSH36_345g03070 [Paralvinella palmiformis]|uniref:PH domain-containing protein n=1 Tax=Paralvinella palmiformis TaxID=53620 RepID=A0AAD9JFS4_9ANNE|nr:hypothetical protein LSH36_345g03070 [Paralvinella palmiformis]
MLIFTRRYFQSEAKRVRHISLSENDIQDQSQSPKNKPSKFKRSLSLTKSFRRNRKPQQYSGGKKSLDHCKQLQKCGHLYQYSSDKSWKKVWCVLRESQLEIFMSKDDKNVISSISLQESTLINELADGFMGRHYVVKLQHQQNKAEFFAMENKLEMADWLAHFMVGKQSNVTTRHRRISEEQISKSSKSDEICENDDDPLSKVIPIEDGEINNDLMETGNKTEEIISKEEQIKTKYKNTEQMKEKQDSDTAGKQTENTEQLNQKEESLEQENLKLAEKHPEIKFQCLMDEQNTEQLDGQQNNKDVAKQQECVSINIHLQQLIGNQQKNTDVLKKQQEDASNKTDKVITTDHSDKEWKQLVVLKQRKISAELKMESLQRALTAGQTKQHKKSRPKLSLDLLKTQSVDCSQGSEGSPEVRHWRHQLEDLQQEHQDIVREIENYEMKHSWYKNKHAVININASPSSANYRLLRESHPDGRTSVRSEVKSEISSGSYEVGTILMKSKSHGQLSNDKNGRQPQSCGSIKQNRLQKIGKRFPNLPLLITKRSLMRTVSNKDNRDITGTEQSSPMENRKLIDSPKSLSSGEYFADNNYRHYDAILPDKASCEGTFGKEMSICTPPRRSTSSQHSSPSSESILSSVMMTLNKFMTVSQTGQSPLERSLSNDSQTAPVTDSNQMDPLLIPADESISPISEANTSVFTEASFETDSGRGSPMTAEVTEVKVNSNERTQSLDIIQSDNTGNPIMKSDTLANIAAFEDLIHEKLGGLAQ